MRTLPLLAPLVILAVMLILIRKRILSRRTLAKFRLCAIIISLVLAAILTTPELISVLFMAIPLYAAYEASVWIPLYWERKEKKRGEVDQ